MKVLVTGANGFLGYYLTEQLLSKGYDVIATGKGESRLPFQDQKNFCYVSMDFTSPSSVQDVFAKYQPETVIHAGAMSRVDDCEQHQWQAYHTNVEGTLNLILNAANLKCFFIFISTDFIFDGEKGMYRENDEPGPVNFYGKSKLEAEEAVKEYEYDWVIVRTILVYGKPHSAKDNLLTVVKKKLEQGDEYKVVSDQMRTPTYVGDLAAGIVSVIEKKATGVYHLGGTDVLTPYDMACLVADYFHYDKSLLKQVTASNFSQPARRPLKTGFNISKAKKELNFQPVTFQEGLRRTFD